MQDTAKQPLNNLFKGARAGFPCVGNMYNQCNRDTELLGTSANAQTFAPVHNESNRNKERLGTNASTQIIAPTNHKSNRDT